MATTGYVEASCGYCFELGKEYLVYSYGGVYSPEVSLCSRTKPLSEAQEDLLVLGAGYVPTQDSAVQLAPQHDDTSFPFVAGVGE